MPAAGSSSRRSFGSVASAGDLQPPLQAVRQRRCKIVAILREVLLFKQLHRLLLHAPVLRHGDAERRAENVLLRTQVLGCEDVFKHRHGFPQADVLERAGNAHAVDLLGRFAGGVHAVKQNGAAGRLIDLGKEVKNGGLARAVRADERDDLALLYFDGDIADDRHLMVADREIVDHKIGRIRHFRPPFRRSIM